ncbi:M48 family metalloprotease [Caenispirillum salinarum]|uniref:M48 family metalloprotease n=1 Tax=Caenispirillum salinarum TaxID=859058 RepID=UPI00384C6F74
MASRHDSHDHAAHHGGCGCGLGLPRLSRRAVLAGGTAAVAAAGLAGCAQNPATGRSSFTGFSDIADDVAVGRREYPKLLEAFGGAYEDRRLQVYVDGILRRMAPYTEYPSLPYEITIANTPIVNAFALPGGKITLTRGLLAMASNEAEVAGVVAHEMGHVTARHSAERQGAGMVAQLGAVLLGAVTGSSEIANLASFGAQAYLQSYSREQELEADMLGVRYMTRAGYDPDAMTTFLATLGDQARLDARMMGRDPSAVDQYNIMATHPRSIERVQRAMQLAEASRPADPVVARETYLTTISGMLFGDDPEQGLVLGQRFVHPGLRFAYEVPDGYRLMNAPDKVVAQHPDGAAIVMDMGASRTDDSAGYLRGWMQGARITNLERIRVNGLPGATAALQVQSRQGPMRAQAVVLPAAQRGRMIRFLFLAPPNAFGRFDEGFRRTTYSVRHLTPAEAAEVEPLRLLVTEVRPGDTVRQLAGGLPYGRWNDEWFRLLNDMQLTDGLRPGDLVKIVAR